MLEQIDADSYAVNLANIETTHAILLHSIPSSYANQGTEVVNATLHEVVDNELSLGSAISTQALIKLLMGGKASRFDIADWIAPNILMDSANTLMWYQKANKRHLFMKNSVDKAQTSLYVKFPATLYVFDRNHRNLRLFALDNDKRPTHDSMLYQLPVGNVSSNGSLCMGNASEFIPDNPNGENCHLIERCFFEALSTHTNTEYLFLKDKEDGKRTLFTQCIQYWKKKAKRGHGVNVKKDLIPLFSIRSLLRG